jgi:hypothetical protein
MVPKVKDLFLKAIAWAIALELASVGVPVFGQVAPPIPSPESIVGSGVNRGLRGPGTFMPNMHTAAVSDAIADKIIALDLGPGTGALANATVYVSTVCPGMAGTVMAVNICANVAPAGGTNTVTLSKDGTTNLLAAANFNPTTLVNNTGTSIPLSTVAGATILDSNDVIIVTWTAGTQTTAAQAPTVEILYAPSNAVDF